MINSYMDGSVRYVLEYKSTRFGDTFLAIIIYLTHLATSTVFPYIERAITNNFTASYVGFKVFTTVLSIFTVRSIIFKQTL